MGNKVPIDEPNNQSLPFAETQACLVLSIPPEMLTLILELLVSKDCGTLKAVAALFKPDLDVDPEGSKVCLRHMAQWVPNLVMRSLEWRVLHYREIPLKNPLLLRELILLIRGAQFTEPADVETLKQALNACKCLRTLHVIIWMPSDPQTYTHLRLGLNGTLVSYKSPDIEEDEAQHPATCETNLLSIPAEVRSLIWEHVPSADHRTLRQVCSLFKWEIEQVTGISIVIKNKAPFVAERTEWLQSVVLRSLELGFSSDIMSHYQDVIFKNPLLLRRLLLNIHEEFGEPAGVGNLQRVLRSYNSLTTLDIYWTISNRYMETLYSETLKCLVRNSALKEFSFHVDDWASEGRAVGAMPGSNYQPLYRFPRQLTKISLRIPISSKREFLDWSALLNAQDRLIQIKLLVRVLGWHFFKPSFSGSGSSLRDLELRLIVPKRLDEGFGLGRQWIPTYNAPGVPIDNDTEHPASLDWSQLSQACYLDSLMVMQSEYPSLSSTVRTHNFSTMSLGTLRSIFLSSVHLAGEDISRIFVEGVSLTSIRIFDWTLAAEWRDRDFCLEQNKFIWRFVPAALQARKFGAFELVGKSLGIVPNYKIVSAVQEAVAAAGLNLVIWKYERITLDYDTIKFSNRAFRYHI